MRRQISVLSQCELRYSGDRDRVLQMYYAQIVHYYTNARCLESHYYVGEASLSCSIIFT